MKIEFDGKTAFKWAVIGTCVAVWAHGRANRTDEDIRIKKRAGEQAPVFAAFGAIVGALVYLVFGNEGGATFAGLTAMCIAMWVIPLDPVLPAEEARLDRPAGIEAAKTAKAAVRRIELPPPRPWR